MNPQGPDKIPYTDFTWNPCTGCKHGCSYCYARPIANRIYKERFEPTFRPERLKEPFEVTKPSKIFVCDMGDLFGEWMEEEVVDKILDVTRRCTQHTFQFLSKNPDYYGWWFGDKKWLGTTLTFDAALHDKEAQRLFMLSQCEQDGVYWVSAEPLLGDPMTIVDEYKEDASRVDMWVIGEQTGRRYTPAQLQEVTDWARDLIGWAHARSHKVFVKNGLKGVFPIAELP